ncbi:molybdopterin cofactor-binding domain-containing protein [Cupriavidus basilensis]
MTTPSWPTAWCSSSASRCSWSWPPRTMRRAVPHAWAMSSTRTWRRCCRPRRRTRPAAMCCRRCTWTRGEPSSHIAGAAHREQGSIRLGGQEQFYLEAPDRLRRAEGKRRHARVVLDPASRTEMQHAVAHMLGWHAHQVLVECRRMGGGFGGKESQSAMFALAAPRWPPGSCCARSSCVRTATTT